MLSRNAARSASLLTPTPAALACSNSLISVVQGGSCTALDRRRPQRALSHLDRVRWSRALCTTLCRYDQCGSDTVLGTSSATTTEHVSDDRRSWQIPTRAIKTRSQQSPSSFTHVSRRRSLSTTTKAMDDHGLAVDRGEGTSRTAAPVPIPLDGDEEADLPEEHEEADEAPSSSTIPATAADAGTLKNFRPGDWVQIRLFGQSKSYIYLQDYVVAARGGRKRALLHGMNNEIVLARFEDIMFRLPRRVPEHIARLACAILRLSPREYEEQQETLPRGDLPLLGQDAASQITGPDGVTLSQDETALLYKDFGIDYSRSSRWKRAYSAKLSCVRALRQVDAEQSELRQSLARPGPDELHKLLVKALKGRTDGFITYKDAHAVLFPNKTASRDGANPAAKSSTWRLEHEMLAVHNLLLNDSDHYIADPVDFLASGQFRLRSEAELRRLKTVREWMRRESAEIQSFRKKALKIRERLVHWRKARTTHSHINRSDDVLAPTPPTFEPWTSADLEIIAFLQDGVEMRRRLQINPHETHIACFLKTIGELTDDAVDTVPDSHGNTEATTSTISDDLQKVPANLRTRVAALRFLVNIGVAEEWSNVVLQDRELQLAEWISVPKRLFDGNLLHVQAPASARPSSNRDGLDGVRHDFGDLPVYTVDEASASEIDDGISVEEAVGKLDNLGKQTYWVHMHIADPTADLHWNDEWAQEAQRRQSTLYLPEMTVPMVPFEIVDRFGWSLGGEPGSNRHQKVLTFSARIGEDGHVHEQKIRAGVVKNVLKTTYDTVNAVFGKDSFRLPTAASDSSGPSSEACLSWPMLDVRKSSEKLKGQHEPVEDALYPVASRDRENFLLLHRLAKGLLRARVARTAVLWMNTSKNGLSKVTLSPRPIMPTFGVSEGPIASGTVPMVQLHLPGSKFASTGSDDAGATPAMLLVSEMMILAGRIAASTLSDAGLSAPFRGQMPPLLPDPRLLQNLLDERDRQTGMIDTVKLRSYNVVFPPGYNASHAVEHWPMGIGASSGGYVRATSPLRRYSDMMTHWQLKSLLQPSSSSPRPPFSRQDVDEAIKEIDRSGRMMKRYERRSVTFWKLFAINKNWIQAKQDPEANPFVTDLLLNKLTAFPGFQRMDTFTLRWIADAFIPELGLLASIASDSPIEESVRIPIDISAIVLDDFSKMYVERKKQA